MNITEFQTLQKKYDELSQKLTAEKLSSSDRLVLQKEHSYLSEVLKKANEIQEIEKRISETQKQASEVTDQELKDLFIQEIADLESNLKSAKKELDDLMFPPDELDKSSIFMEIRAGAGGLEASLFVADLLRMYSNYALKRNWQVSIVDLSESDVKGYKEVILHIKGKYAYGALKREAGVHRVQRVPTTETQGRVHTSTVSVAVFPEVNDDIDLNIKPEDIRIDVYRAGGAGGQHVNKTESAVRITHIPTGIVVACQDDRSQHKNKDKAFKVLKSRLAAYQKEKQDLEMQQKRKEQVGTGMRAEKIRTYNFPQNRVTDHQVDLTLSKLNMVMEGDLDDIIDALQEKEKQDRRKLQV